MDQNISIVSNKGWLTSGVKPLSEPMTNRSILADMRHSVLMHLLDCYDNGICFQMFK